MLISTQNLIFYVTKVGLRSEMLIILTGSCCCGCFFSSHPNATRLDEKLNSNSNLNSFSRSSFLLFSFFDVFFCASCLYMKFLSLFSRGIDGAWKQLFRRDNSFESVDEIRLAVDITGHSFRAKIQFPVGPPAPPPFNLSDHSRRSISHKVS